MVVLWKCFFLSTTNLIQFHFDSISSCLPSLSALPNTVLDLTQQDMIDFIVERGDGVAAPTATDRDETLFRQNTPGAEEQITVDYCLQQKSWNKFSKKLCKRNMAELNSIVVQRPEQPTTTGLSKGHLACVHLVLRSHLLLTTRKKELGYIFDAYDQDGNGSMSSNELKILLNDIARKTATANGNGSGSASDGNPQADDDDGMATVQGRGQNSNNNNNSQMTSDDLNMFIASMDSNGDGKLGKDEFLDYCMRGMNMGNKQRQAFSQRSAMHAKLQLFITNILKRIEETTR
jgi:Ca2+-binding EF-hand superfamily protein